MMRVFARGSEIELLCCTRSRYEEYRHGLTCGEARFVRRERRFEVAADDRCTLA